MGWDGQAHKAPLLEADRVGVLIEEFGISEEMAAKIPPDEPRQYNAHLSGGNGGGKDAVGSSILTQVSRVLQHTAHTAEAASLTAVLKSRA